MVDKQIVIPYQVYQSISELTEANRNLIVKAWRASQDAYAPYSAFQVGAALRTKNNLTVVGFNQENASYPCGICAERAAIYNFGIQNKLDKIETLAIVVFNKLAEIAFPCGFCRQVMVEAEQANEGNIQVLLGHPETEIMSFSSCKLLLPFSFHKGFLTAVG